MEDSDDVQREHFEKLVDLQKSDPAQAVKGFRALLNEALEQARGPGRGEMEDDNGADADAAAERQQSGVSRYQEWAILHLCALHAELKQTDALVALLNEVRPLFAHMPKAKTAKVVRTVIDSMAKIPGTDEAQVALCHEYIEWCVQEKRAFLRQRIQTRLANLLLNTGRFQAALKLLADLQAEIKKLDDKQLLVEIFLIESRVHHALLNLPRAKSSLTAARSVSNSIYVGPVLQGEIDMQSGLLNADEKDFRVAYSYFFEAFEGFVNLNDARALPCVKYMLLCKIMNNQGDEVPAILNTKNALKYAGGELEAMRAIARAYKDRSLQSFGAALKQFAEHIVDDQLVQRHLKDLQANLLEQNLVRLIEPFSRIEIARVAQLIDLPTPQVEQKLSQMILDKKFLGILDQGAGELVVFDDPVTDSTYEASMDMVGDMSNVVDSLFRRTQKLES